VFAAFAGSDSARALRDSLQVARQRLLDALRVSDADPVAQEATVMRARQSLEQAERRLARVSTVYQRERSYDQIGIREVAAALPSDARLVAFSRYRQYRRVPSVITISGQALHGALLDTMSAYVAFVLDGSSHSVHAISLGSAGEIDSLVASWRQAAESPPRSAGRSKATEQACRMTGWALRRRVWDPLADFGGGANRAFVVPDGALLLVNFAALPAKRDSFLAETGPLIHVLSAERDLARRPSARDLDGELLVMGDPVFPLPRTAPGGNPGVPRWDPAPGAAARGPVPCFDPNTAFFASLPGSAEEVRDVAALWRDPGARSRTRGRVARVYLGREATKRNFLESAAHARVIHLATHAYSISEACTTYVVRPGGPGRPPVQSAVVHSDVPLLRSGIVFAGDAGSSPPGGPRAGRDDFVVTAQEIAGLDLSGVDWAVVSACDAGLGVFRPGEGLFGLRRAFQIAGARTTIMGLWKVDDAATQAWMRELYRARLTDRLQTAEAVREADHTILRTRRARGLSVHPAFWASFIATGDWR
jgi:CHAT domain-containing protein